MKLSKYSLLVIILVLVLVILIVANPFFQKEDQKESNKPSDGFASKEIKEITEIKNLAVEIKSLFEKKIEPKIETDLRRDLKNLTELAELEHKQVMKERNSNMYQSFNIGANWPCFWGAEITGDLEGLKKEGDGWKYTCGLRKITYPCVVYSFGSRGNMAFEKEILKLKPECEIYIFDKDNFGTEKWFSDPELSKHVHFERAYIAKTENLNADPPRYNIFTIMKKYNHNHIDILKVDIDGSEFELLSSDLPSVGQMQVEFHFAPLHKSQNERKDFHQVVSNLESHGFRIFHKEVNIYAPIPGNVAEFAFIQREWLPEKKFYPKEGN